jgi:folate-dependent tRNA-U54 methylase TrmFO/GidA
VPSFTGVKVFSTTLARDREVMGDTVTRWLAAHPGLEIVDREVRQSSDKEFHCLSIVLFFRERKVD